MDFKSCKNIKIIFFIALSIVVFILCIFANTFNGVAAAETKVYSPEKPPDPPIRPIPPQEGINTSSISPQTGLAYIEANEQ